MKIRFRQTGGFGGLVLGCDLDTSTLPPAEAQELTRLVKQTNLEKIQPQRSEKARDLQNYEIAVEGEGLTAKATFDDMSVDPNVDPLLEFLRQRARAMPLDG
ncbi:MAG TPA: protealysin inhibitor emfourin [Candidatus Binatia bacterium]|nr:protealysin inhibitor emfourin [Candidatus Binatia bacterium]HSF59718.1 protealysin inhibitor emfourin [Candidatus Binatia bacterium]